MSIMIQGSNFQIYNASAGSGKTFTLVKEYLKVLLASKDAFYFQKILAITFTNKATGEMKERVLQNLKEFSDGQQNDLLGFISEEISIDKPTIKLRSKLILRAILQNYSAFSITTIDSFTHKIIRSFAHDLGLSNNFEVEMDSESLLKEAVESVISKIGTDQRLTKLLISFCFDKIDDGKSLDISNELNQFSKIILYENDANHFKKLSDKKLDSFALLYSNLNKQIQSVLRELQKIGQKGLSIIENANLEHKDFYYSSLPNHFLALATNIEKASFFDQTKLKEQIENHIFYTKSKSAEIKSVIESIIPELVDLYQESENYYSELLLCRLTLKSVVPLAVLKNINQALDKIKKENDILLSHEFNKLIANAIKDQPAPFIYERVGQRFMHYFIDEMQDTSVLQWQNLIPLINNALSQENSSLFLVGDGKQAIYRWRGGQVEQFINLGLNDQNQTNPFPVPKQVKTLETNYRSFSEVVNFNNNFFSHISKFFREPVYKQLFEQGNNQLENDKKGGFVSLSFLEKQDDKDEETIKYPKKVLEIIGNVRKYFSLGDICVLVRKKKQGVAIADYLSENQIPIISSESLLLKNSSKVDFVINMLRLIQNPKDEETLFEILYFLYGHLQILADKHLFINSLIDLNNRLIFNELESYGVYFKLSTFYSLSFYDKVEQIIRSFNLIDSSDAYLQYFLDVVLEQQKKGSGVEKFLDFWDDKKKDLSIVAPDSSDAVRVMTIHKSKGLEFPVVIFPYDLDIHWQKNNKVWLDDLHPKIFEDFQELLVPFEKDLQYVNQRGLSIYQKELSVLELDNFNLLYVALTRAVEQLYIITEKKIVNSTGCENTRFYSGLFINYLKEKGCWNDDVLEYNFGSFETIKQPDKQNMSCEQQRDFTSTSWSQHNIHIVSGSSKLWGTNREKAIEFGDLIHQMMSKITIRGDVQPVIRDFVNQGLIDKTQALFIEKIILAVVMHPRLTRFYSQDVVVFNEREIITGQKEVIVPDRLVFVSKKQAVIIDYKTGKPSEEHKTQVQKYERVLNSMNIEIIEKLLVYIDKDVSVIDVG